MSRIRTIKPEFWTSEQVMECSPLARLAFIGMWNFCDDNGVHPASCKTLKAEVFPGDDLTAANVQTLVNELLQQQLLAEFQAEGRQWWFVTGWRHQLINRPSKSRYPLPPRTIAPLPKAAGQDDDSDPTPESDINHGVLSEPSVSTHGTLIVGREGRGKEGKGKEGRGEEGSTDSRSAASRPAPALKTPCPADLAITSELQAWARDHGYREDLIRHLDHFRDKAIAKGYQYADWNAALRNAIRDDWAGIRTPPPQNRRPPDLSPPPQSPFRNPRADEFDAILRGEPAGGGCLIEGELADAIH